MRVFNVLKRWLLVLVCAVSSVCAMEFTKGELCEGIPIAKVVCAEDMSKKTGDFESILDSERTELAEKISMYPDASHVVFFGDTGAGKTTLANLLTGREVLAEKVKGRIILAASGVHHGVGSGTKQISCYYSECDNTCYWDLPGLRDSNGWEKDTLNAILRKQLFDSLPNAKIVVVAKSEDMAGRATNFGALLKYVVAVFPEENLPFCSYLAVTQSDIIDMQEFLGRMLEDSGSDSNLSDQYVNNLLTFIATNSVQRTSNFMKPSAIGAYGLEVTQEMLEKLKSVEAQKLIYKTVLQPETIHHVRDKAGEYNAQIAEFIRGDISQAIKAAVYGQISSAIERHDKMAEQLKELFGGYAARLVSLEPTNYVGGLKSLLTDLGLFSILDDSRFNLFSMLTTFGDLLGEALSVPDQWAEALELIKQDLLRLQRAEMVDGLKTAINNRTADGFHTRDDMIFDRKKGKKKWARFNVADGVTFERATNFGAIFDADLILKEMITDKNVYAISASIAERDGWNFKGSIDTMHFTPVLLTQKIGEYSQHE